MRRGASFYVIIIFVSLSSSSFRGAARGSIILIINWMLYFSFVVNRAATISATPLRVVRLRVFNFLSEERWSIMVE
jgi:hypothetical protein